MQTVKHMCIKQIGQAYKVTFGLQFAVQIPNGTVYVCVYNGYEGPNHRPTTHSAY